MGKFEMRRFGFAALTVMAVGVALTAKPARAETDYPICMQIGGPDNYIKCDYKTMAECAMAASGRSAECKPNPFMAKPPVSSSPTPPKR